MIMNPNDLPRAEDAQISPGLRRVTGWRLENHDNSPTPQQALEFIDRNKKSFFKSMFETLKKIDNRRSIHPTA